MEKTEIENLAMEIIAHSGDARSLAFTALYQAKKGEETAAKESLKKAKESSKLAHVAHSKLLTAEARGEVPQVCYLMVHAQDHLTGSMLALELIEEMIELYQRKEDKTK